MGDLRLVLVQTRAQLASIARNRRAVVITLVIPVMLLVLFNSIFVGGDDTVDLMGAKVTAPAYFTGGMVAYAVVGSAFSTLAITLVTQRETGQLKRYRGTPMPAWTFVAAVVLRVLAMVGVATVALLVIARVAYGVDISPEALVETALYVLVGTAALCSIGIAATAVATDVDTASAAVPLVTLLLALVSDIFIPVDQLPGWIADIGRALPLYHVAAGVQVALGASGDMSLHVGDIAVLGAWAAGGVIVAVRRFRWEPQVTAA
jgi:ABC-2 type transport system permease protein